MGFLGRLAARRRFGMKPGLDTIAALCARLGDPQRAFPAVHVAGTNGKGAVCAILDAALRESGLRVGLYTSPHLVMLNERFRIGGEMLSDATLDEAARRVEAACDAGAARDVTFFEALTAVAFLAFAEAKVDVAVVETGLGGRLDATNVCRPAVSVITRIGLDHCDWLGDTVERIAAEKAGIVKPGVPVVLGANCEEARRVVEERARELGSPFFHAPDLASPDEIPSDFPLKGSFNRENAQTALAALRALKKMAAAHDRRCLGRGLGDARIPGSCPNLPKSISWPGRYQRVGAVLVDGAHNPPAARALADALAADGTPPRSLVLVAGFCGDKDADGVLGILAPYVSRGCAVATNNPRSLPADVTAAKMRAAGIPAEAFASLRAALASAHGSPALVCGSLFLAGEALVELGAAPWAGPVARFDPSERLA